MRVNIIWFLFSDASTNSLLYGYSGRTVQGLVTLCRKATVQTATVQNVTMPKSNSAESHSSENPHAEMGNVTIVVSSRFKMALCNY